jgi:hypothetical protein
MIWENEIKENKVNFLAAVNDVSTIIGVNPNWLMHVMHIESGLNPQAVNSITGATGLIQFMPSTSIRLGVTTDVLKNMDNVRQMQFVNNYFFPFKGKLKSPIDVYFAVFYPIAIGKSDNWILQSKAGTGFAVTTNDIGKLPVSNSATTVATANRGYDVGSKGYLTVGDVTSVVMGRVPTMYSAIFMTTKKK